MSQVQLYKKELSTAEIEQNWINDKSTFGFSKYPNVGKHVGGIIPLFVSQPITFLLSNFS